MTAKCLHCGAALPVFRKLTGGDFCSDAHQQKYQQELNRIALSRLKRPKAKAEEPPPRPKPAAVESEPLPPPPLREPVEAPPDRVTAATESAPSEKRAPEPPPPPAFPDLPLGRPIVGSIPRVNPFPAPRFRFSTALVPFGVPDVDLSNVAEMPLHTTGFDPKSEDQPEQPPEEPEPATAPLIASPWNSNAASWGPRSMRRAEFEAMAAQLSLTLPSAPTVRRQPSPPLTALDQTEVAAEPFETPVPVLPSGAFEFPTARVRFPEIEFLPLRPAITMRPPSRPAAPRKAPQPKRASAPVAVAAAPALKAAPPAPKPVDSIERPSIQPTPPQNTILVLDPEPPAVAPVAVAAAPAPKAAPPAPKPVAPIELPSIQPPRLQSTILALDPEPPAPPPELTLGLVDSDSGSPVFGFWTRLSAKAKIMTVVLIVAAFIASAVYKMMPGPAPKTAPGGFAASTAPGALPAGGTISMGGSGWVTEWAGDSAGSKRAVQLTLYKTSQQLKDYRTEFTGQIEKASMGWVFRVRDTKNYYAMKIRITKAGPEPTVSLTRYAVIDGQEGPKVDVPLPLMVRNDTIYKVKLDVRGPRFMTTIQGKTVDVWSDDRIGSGAFGFSNERGERAHIRSVSVSF